MTEPVPDAALAHAFNWQEEPRDSFLSWMIPTVLAGMPGSLSGHFELLERLSKLTDSWERVELSIFINGVEVLAQPFLDGIKRNMDYFAREAAKEKLREVAGLGEVEEAVQAFRDGLKERLAKLAEQLDVKLYEEDDW